MRASSSVLAGAWLLLAALVPGLARADSDIETRLRDQLRQTTISLREAQDENAAIKAKQSGNDAQVQSLTAQLATAKQQLADAEGKANQADEAQQALAAAQDRAKSAEETLKQTETNLAKWQEAYKQAADVARQRDADAKSLAAGNADLDHKIGNCTAKNVELYNIGTDILGHYQSIDIGDLLARKEVFTQLARVKLENAVQDYQDKLRDQKLPAPVATSPEAPQPAPAPAPIPARVPAGSGEP